MTPYLEACFGGGGRIGFFVTGTSESIRRESDWECDYDHEPESTVLGARGFDSAGVSRSAYARTDVRRKY
jgi:hypothetical protein